MTSPRLSACLVHAMAVMLLITACWGQEDRPGEGRSRADLPPRFLSSMEDWTVVENTPVGTSVYRLRAVAANEKPIVYEVVSNYFTVDPSTGVVTLKEELDYEKITNTTVTVVIYPNTDSTNRVERRVLVRVVDVNDIIPSFNADSFTTTFSESLNPGSTVVSNIRVFDDDPSNDELTVVCLRRAPVGEEDACDSVRIQTVESSNTGWLGRIVTSRILDFETQKSYLLPLQASDGVHIRIMEVTLEIEDAEDTPPVFIGSLTASIAESTPVGTEVMQFSAQDGDTTVNRQIRFHLAPHQGGYFTLDPNTGKLVTKRTIDREGVLDGYFTLQIEAIELREDGTETTDPNSRTLVQATVTITDGNDNGPRFERISPEQVDIKEDIPDGSPIGTTITVSDSDQGANGQFELVLLSHNDTFEVFPTQGAGTLTAGIRVKDTRLIDFDAGLRTYSLRILARETQTPERLTSNGLITVSVRDTNDNPPIFPESSYEASVSEMAPGGTSIITITATDADSGIYGEQGLRYKLVGNGAEKFIVNRVTGEITVKQCPTPGEGNCLDTEQQSVYTLDFMVRDNYAEGYLSQVPLTIRILDENDNAPIFQLGNYESYIKEGEINPVPAINVEATDKDTFRNDNNAIIYSIVGGNVGNLWRIGRTSGAIVASRPVSYAGTPGGLGMYTLTVQAADPKYRTTGTVQIHVLDTNDYPPVFYPSNYYEEYIPEDTPPGTTVLTVLAEDNDAPNSPNGQVRYRIIFGSGGKFVIDPITGVITVNQGAVFDFDKQKRYQMTVMAEDQGSPKRNATATVVIHIRDANNKNPYFEPSSVRTDVYENVPVDTQVTKMTAKDPDSNAVLVYSFVDPISAWGPNGRRVNINTYNFKNLFRIEPNTGVVRTRTRLDHDRAAVITLTVQVEDTGKTGIRKQTATGTLIVNVLDINVGPPTFPNPWTPTNPYLNIRVQEELPTNYYVTTIIATDPYDSVVEYRIIDDPGNYFNIDENTGVVTINRRIDYEQIQRTVFTVTARDDGRPSLTSTATVNVNIMNINDNNPEFTEDEYDIELMENTPTGATVAIVTATDLDLGEYGIVRYNLEDPQNRFTIDPITGVIRVRDGAKLDRESTDLITITIIAYDSPNSPNERRSTTVPMYITLLDDNDHTPVFTHQVFNTSVLESVPVSTSVIRLTATDGDTGRNAELEYTIISGDGRDLFRIINEERGTGLVVTSTPLNGRAGRYTMTISVRDRGTPRRQGTATLIVDIIEANNEAPRWIRPRSDNETVDALENQYLGMIITQVKAVDDGEGKYGDVIYGFQWNGVFVEETPNFRINPYTGVITAKRVFDREARDTYTVLLVARDGGRPPYQSLRYLTIKISDTNDHDPEFPKNMSCCTIPYIFNVTENLPSKQFVGRVHATDLDIGQNAETRYYIIDGNLGESFFINATTGGIYTDKPLDHEFPLQGYRLTIRASHVVTPNRPELLSAFCTCRDPSVVAVVIRVIDTNDFRPLFSHAVYNSCVSIDAPFDKSILTVVAADRDNPTTTQVTYRINETAVTGVQSPRYLDLFTIGSDSGVISTNALMSEYKDNYFYLGVLAADPGGLASWALVRIWVTGPTTELKITVKQTPEEVKQPGGKLEQIIQLVSEKTGGGIVCVSDVRFHIDTGGTINLYWTDIILHVIDGNSLLFYTTGQLIPLLWPSGGGVDPVMEGLLIENVAAASVLWGGFVIDPVLAAIILIILLLLLALLLLCCLCCCMKSMARREAHKSGLMIEPLMKSNGTINPIWRERLYEDQELNMKLDTVGGHDNAGFEVGQVAHLTLGGGAGGAGGMTQTTTTSEYQMNYERTHTQQLLGEDTVDASNIRIEAPLAPVHGNAAMILNGSSNYGQSLAANSATQVELMSSKSSLRQPSSGGPSQIGARLHSYTMELPQEVYSSDFNGYSSASAANVSHEAYGTSTWPRQGFVNGHVVQDIQVEGPAYSTYASDAPDGLYQGEIILGSLHPPHFPNRQQHETRYHTESRQMIYDDSTFH